MALADRPPRGIRRYLPGALLLPWLAAAGAGDAPAPASDSAAQAVAAPAATEASLPLEEIVIRAREPRYVERTRRDHIGRIWAPVLIDGKGPFRLVLDTGATRTAIIARVAEVMGRSTVGQPQMRLRGVTGSSVVPTIAVDRLEFGDLLVPAQRLPIIPDAFGGADGVLGTEGLKDRRVYIDFMNDLITVARSHGQRAPDDFIVVPFSLEGGHLLVTDARVGGVYTKLIIDTGAQVSVGNLALRDALRRHRDRDVTTDSIVGVTLDVEETEGRNVPTIHVGSLGLNVRRLEFADVNIFKHWNMTGAPAVLVGMDLLGLLDRLVIDYRLRELHLRLVGARAG